MTFLIFTYQVLWAIIQLFKGNRKSKITATKDTSQCVFILLFNSSQSNCAAGYLVYAMLKFESYTQNYIWIIFSEIYNTGMIDLVACFEVLYFVQLVPKFWCRQALKNHIRSEARETSLSNFHFLMWRLNFKSRCWPLYGQNTNFPTDCHRLKEKICNCFPNCLMHMHKMAAAVGQWLVSQSH